jgi:hypothetical protein
MSALGRRIAVSAIACWSAVLLAPAALNVPTSSVSRVARVGGVVPAGSSVVSPFLRVGPQAIAAETAGPNYGLFTCQVIGLNPSETCYDPYQIRHAYNIDTLVNAGFDGGEGRS